MMKLLVFDLDGTLTKTNAVDEECFVQAFADVFSIRDVNTRWSEYDHVTDVGVLQQVFRTRSAVCLSDMRSCALQTVLRDCWMIVILRVSMCSIKFLVLHLCC